MVILLMIEILILIVVVGIKIKIGHQVGLYIIHRFGKGLDEFVKILFVKENLMPVVTIVVEAFTTLRDGKVIVVAPCGPDIKEIGSSFTGANTLTVNAFHSFVVILVRHSQLVLFVAKFSLILTSHKYNIVFELTKFNHEAVCVPQKASYSLIISLLCLLPVIQSGINAIQGQQFGMGAFLGNPPVFQHHDLIELKMGEYPVGDDDGGPVLQKTV